MWLGVPKTPLVRVWSPADSSLAIPKSVIFTAARVMPEYVRRLHGLVDDLPAGGPRNRERRHIDAGCQARSRSRAGRPDARTCCNEGPLTRSMAIKASSPSCPDTSKMCPSDSRVRQAARRSGLAKQAITHEPGLAKPRQRFNMNDLDGNRTADQGIGGFVNNTHTPRGPIRADMTYRPKTARAGRCPVQKKRRYGMSFQQALDRPKRVLIGAANLSQKLQPFALGAVEDLVENSSDSLMKFRRHLLCFGFCGPAVHLVEQP